MYRFIIVALLLTAQAFHAHAWKNYSTTDRFDTECRTPNNGAGCIIEADQVYVRPSVEGAAPKRLSLVKRFSFEKEELIPILEKHGTTA